MVSLSMNSKRAGTTEDLRNSVVTLLTESHPSKVTSRRLVGTEGRGMILRYASVITPSVPSLPTKRCRRSYPALFFGKGSPNFVTFPFGRTTRIEITHSFIVPYFTHRRPPEPSAIAPPTVQI